MRGLRSILARESGQAMVVAVFTFALLTTLAVALTDVVTSESQASGQAVASDASYQAAESGIDNYLSKLVADKQYYAQYVDPAEATRQNGSNSTVAVSSACTATTMPSAVAWSYPSTPAWTYPNGKDRWCQLSNGYEYDLQITPPSATQSAIQIISTGRRTGSTNLGVDRVLEVLVQPSSISDYYRLVGGDVSIDAITNGKVYAGGDINHTGTANASLYAEGSITGNPTMGSLNGVPATKYTPSTNPSIRAQPGLSSPLNFSDFLVSLSTLSRAAQNAGINIDDSSKAAFKLTFLSNGTIQVKSCTSAQYSEGSSSAPSCSTYTPTGGSNSTLCSAGVCSVPTNGAIYLGQTAIVSGSVKGRVTVASNNNIDLAGPISPVTSGTDVIGLIAENNFEVESYCCTQGSDLTWSAAVLAQTGTWGTADNFPSQNNWADTNGDMTFTGSSATLQGGGFSFNNRTYNYDQTLQYLPPPWFPSVGTSPYQITLFRELPSG